MDSGDLRSFLRHLAATRLVEVDVRTNTDGRLLGYKLTYGRSATPGQERVWFSGATLAPDLSGPALQHRWDSLATRPVITAATWPDGRRAPLPGPQQHQIIATAEDITARAHAAFSTTNTLTTAGLTQPDTDYDTELGVLPTAVADLLDRLGHIDHTHTLTTAADAFHLAAGRPPNPASTVSRSRWAPLARDLRLASRDLAHIGRLTTPTHAVATAALLLAVAGLIAEIAVWREQRGQLAAAAAARRAHTALTRHRLITHLPQPPTPTRPPAPASPAKAPTRTPRISSPLDRPHTQRPPHPEPGRGRTR